MKFFVFHWRLASLCLVLGFASDLRAINYEVYTGSAFMVDNVSFAYTANVASPANFCGLRRRNFDPIF